MRNFPLDSLRTLISIAEQGSFSAAAEISHKTQSTVTQQIQRLETELGLKLFEKKGRSKRLTIHGQCLVDYARRMLAIQEEALRTLHDQQLTGSLRFGSTHDVAETVLPPLLGHIARTTPRLKIAIHIERSSMLMSALRRGDIDITISTSFDPNFEGAVLRTSPMAWICAASYVHNPHSPVPLILPEEPSITRQKALDAMAKIGQRWHTDYSVDNLVAIKAAVKAELGITVRPIEMLSSEMRVLGIKDGFPPLEDITYFLWIRRDMVNPITRRVFDMLRSNMDLKDAVA